MNHSKGNRKFNRTANQRRALLKQLASSLVRDEKITTTEAKAKELRPVIEKLTTRAQKNDVNTHRIITARLGGKTAAKKLITEIAPRYKERKGGYTRIVKMPTRRGDAARMAVIEFV